MRIGAIQSNYIPWKGYFDLIQRCDLVLILDHLQYTRNDWRNRNQIVYGDKLKWLSIPVRVKLGQSIDSVLLPNGNWRRKHVGTLRHAYSWSKHFHLIEGIVISEIENTRLNSLSELNLRIIRGIATELMSADTIFKISPEFPKLESKSERLAETLAQHGCTNYISGPRAREYLNEIDFISRGIRLTFMKYEYSPYPTFNRKYFNNASIIDAMAHLGENLNSIFVKKI